MKRQISKRNRGVILTSEGLNKLEHAKEKASLEKGNHISYEELKYDIEERIDIKCLSLTTIRKIFKRSQPVDKESLESIFKYFSLELLLCDYIQPQKQQDSVKSLTFA